jgi:hypothetical protein
LVYDLRPCELQLILDTVKQNKFGSKKVLCKRVLNLLSASPIKTKLLTQNILQVYKARLEADQMYQQHPQPPTPLLIQHPHESHFSPQYFQQPPSYKDFKNKKCTVPYTTNTLPFFNEVHDISTTKFENLPFFKTIETLLFPIDCTTVVDSANFTGLFFLTDDVRHTILKSWNNTKQEYKVQIILRLVRRGVIKYVTDRLPYNLNVSVNGFQCKLPTMNIPMEADIIPWRCNVPIDITQLTDLRNCSQNTLNITWSEDSQNYTAVVCIAQKLTWSELLVELKKRPLRASDKTKELIKKSMESDADMVVASMFVTIKDPLGKMRMNLPSRGINCIHLQCFDAIQFLQMNEQKQTWTCPLCKKKIRFEDIEVDEFFLNILQNPNLSNDCENIILSADGTWHEKKPGDFSYMSRINDNHSSNHIEAIILSDSDDEDDHIDHTETKRRKCNSPYVEESLKNSEPILQTEDLTRTNDNNSADGVFVLDLSLKNNSFPSTNSKYEPIIILNDDSNSQSLTESSNILNSFYSPNISISNCCNNECYVSRSTNSGIKSKHREIAKSRDVLCVLTLD